MSKIITINIYKDYKYYKVIINHKEFIMHTPLGKKHARKIALEEWKKENHPIIYSCEEIKNETNFV